MIESSFTVFTSCQFNECLALFGRGAYRLLLTVALLSGGQLGAAEQSGFFRWSGGVVYRHLGGVDWRTQSQSPEFLSSYFGPNLEIPGLAGAETGGQHVYQDGFVLADVTGGDVTWNWGYTSAAQQVGGDLVFHGDGGIYNVTEFVMSSEQGSSDLDGVGLNLQLEWVQPVNATLSWGIAGGLMYVPFDSDRNSTTLRGTHRAGIVGVEDRYSVAGLFPPSAPYAGDFNTPGPVVPLDPTARTVIDTGAGVVQDLVNEVNQELSLHLVTLSLGPTVAWNHGRWGLQGSAGLALNIASWKAEQREVLRSSVAGKSTRTLAEWSQSESQTQLLAGAFGQLAVRYALSQRWQAALFARYDWSRGIDGEVGGTTFHADLSGVTGGLMVGCTF